MQAIASKGELTAPVALKAVASDWPFYGKLHLTEGRKAGAPPEGTVWIAQGTAARLGIKSGDSFRIGGQTVPAGGVIKSDPVQLRSEEARSELQSLMRNWYAVFCCQKNT